MPQLHILKVFIAIPLALAAPQGNALSWHWSLHCSATSCSYGGPLAA